MHERAQQSSVPTPAWSAVALLAGFFLGIPAALILDPRLTPLLSHWLNPLGVNVAVALLAGAALGTISVALLSLAEAIGLPRFR